MNPDPNYTPTREEADAWLLEHGGVVPRQRIFADGVFQLSWNGYVGEGKSYEAALASFVKSARAHFSVEV